MRGVVENSFRLNLTIMKYFGLYPVKKYSRFHKFYSYALYTIAVVPAVLLGCIQLFLQQETNRAFDPVTISIIPLSPKLLAVVANSENLRRCISHFDNDIFINQSEYHMDIVNNCVKICRRNSYIFIYGCTMGLFVWAGKDLLNDDSKLPLDVWVPFSYAQIWYNFLYFDLILTTFYAGLVCGSVDPLIAGLLCHASGQVQVLKENLKNLDDDIYGKITGCIDHYTAIVSIVEECERYFSPSIFLQLMESVVLICFSCLQIVKLKNYNIDFFMMFIYLVFGLIQVFFYCYYGTILIEENNTVKDAIYESNWYDFDQQSKKALIILMERSKKSLTITAGKILDLSLETFTLVLKRSYSLLAVLKNY